MKCTFEFEIIGWPEDDDDGDNIRKHGLAYQLLAEGIVAVAAEAERRGVKITQPSQSIAANL